MNRFKKLCCTAMLLVMASMARAQLSNFILTNDFGWSTHPSSTSSCPDWVVSSKNVGAGTFYAGCGLSLARDGNGPHADKHALDAWFKANVFCETNPGTKSILRVVCNAKIAATASVALSHAEEPGGATGSALGRILRDETVYPALATNNAIGTITDTLDGTLEDGWLLLGKHYYTVKKPSWQPAGGQYRATVTLPVFPTDAYCSANSPNPAGCLVDAVANGKSHFTYVSHNVTINSSEPTPQANLTLSGYSGTEDHAASIVYFNSSSTTVLGTGHSMVAPDGLLYAETDLPTGTYDIYVRVKGFLRKKFDNVSVTDGIYSGLTATLVNGDINRDNSIDVADYALISANYSLSDSDTTWDRIDENFVAPKDCDLNGDGSIDIADYAIISANYNQEGD